AKNVGADLEIVALAAWLHDIGSIIYGRKDHHLTSAKIAEKFLAGENYDSKKTEIVLDCIKHHRQSTDFERKTVEEKVIADADAICNFDMLPGLFYAALVTEKLSPIEAAKSIKKKLENKWRRMHFQESRDLIKPKYKAAMLLLKEITKL
ncbi:MAG: HD domain-containing protein, partial [Candidatus Berkelbacteria bacterium]|nr:HD domain-containing protein [Candidatus Berkelbacteria bacterium]